MQFAIPIRLSPMIASHKGISFLTAITTKRYLIRIAKIIIYFYNTQRYTLFFLLNNRFSPSMNIAFPMSFRLDWNYMHHILHQKEYDSTHKSTIKRIFYPIKGQNNMNQITPWNQSKHKTKSIKLQGKMNEMRKHEKGLQKGIYDEGQNDLCV